MGEWMDGGGGGQLGRRKYTEASYRSHVTVYLCLRKPESTMSEESFQAYSPSVPGLMVSKNQEGSDKASLDTLEITSMSFPTIQMESVSGMRAARPSRRISRLAASVSPGPLAQLVSNPGACSLSEVPSSVGL